MQFLSDEIEKNEIDRSAKKKSQEETRKMKRGSNVHRASVVKPFADQRWLISVHGPMQLSIGHHIITIIQFALSQHIEWAQFYGQAGWIMR